MFNGDENAGIRFWDGAKSGATTATFTDPAATWASYLPAINPALVLLALGANDGTANMPIPTYTANLQSLIATFRAGRTVPPSIVILTHPGTREHGPAGRLQRVHAGHAGRCVGRW